MRTLRSMLALSMILGVLMYGWNNFWVSERVLELEDFNSIHTDAPIKVYLKRGNANKVVIRADNKVHDKMTVEVNQGQLRIFNNAFIRGERVLEAHITYRALDSLNAGGASTSTSHSVIEADQFKIVAEGAGEVKVRINCEKLDLKMRNVANVFLSGTADEFDFSIDHVGDLTAYNFNVLKCRVKVITGDQSPGIARINVSEELSVHIEGPRYLYYRGSPKITEQIIKGKGKVVARN